MVLQKEDRLVPKAPLGLGEPRFESEVGLPTRGKSKCLGLAEVKFCCGE